MQTDKKFSPRFKELAFWKNGVGMRRLVLLAKDEGGATAIEYALIGVLVSIAAVVAMQNLGGTISNTYSTVSANLSAVAP